MQPYMWPFVMGGFFAILHGAAAGEQPYFIKILMGDILNLKKFPVNLMDSVYFNIRRPKKQINKA